MSLESQDISLSVLYSRVLFKTETELVLSMYKSKVIGVTAKRNLIRAIQKARILLARLLVILRLNFVGFYANSQLDENGKSSMQISQEQLGNLLKKISSITSVVINMDGEYRERIDKIANSIPRSISFQQSYHYLFLRNLPKSIASFRIKDNKVIVVSPRFYFIVFKIIDESTCRIGQIRVKWPIGCRISDHVVKEYVKKWICFDPKDSDVFQSIDGKLRDLVSTSMFVKIVKSLSLIAKDYGCSIKYSDKLMKLCFSVHFAPYNEFIIEIVSYRVLIRSKTPLFIPPKSEYVETTDNCVLFNDYLSFCDRQIIVCHLDKPDTDFNTILSYLRDAVCYTRIRNMWLFVIRTLIITTPIRIKGSFNFSPVAVSQSEIVLKYALSDLCSIFIDSKTGKPGFHLSWSMGIDTKQLYKDFTNSMFSYSDFFSYLINARTVYYGFNVIFGNHIQHFLPQNPLRMQPIYHVSFSFSSDYILICMRGNFKPRFIVSSIDGNDNRETPNLAAFNSMTKRKMPQSLLTAIKDAKNLILLSQLQKDLSEIGALSVVYANGMKIIIKPSLFIRLKIRHGGYWKLVFYKNGYPFFSDGFIVFNGDGLTSRFSEYIVSIIRNVQLVGILSYQLRTISLSDTVTRFSQCLDTLCFEAVVSQYNIRVMFSGYSSSYSISEQLKLVHILSRGVLPSIQCYINTSSIRMNLSDHIKSSNHENIITPFFRSQIAKLVLLLDIMNQYQDWCIIQIQLFSLFMFIFKRSISLLVQIGNSHEMIISLSSFVFQKLLMFKPNDPQFSIAYNKTNLLFRIPIKKYSFFMLYFHEKYEIFKILDESNASIVSESRNDKYIEQIIYSDELSSFSVVITSLSILVSSTLSPQISDLSIFLNDNKLNSILSFRIIMTVVKYYHSFGNRLLLSLLSYKSQTTEFWEYLLNKSTLSIDEQYFHLLIPESSFLIYHDHIAKSSTL